MQEISYIDGSVGELPSFCAAFDAVHDELPPTAELERDFPDTEGLDPEQVCIFLEKWVAFELSRPQEESEENAAPRTHRPKRPKRGAQKTPWERKTRKERRRELAKRRLHVEESRERNGQEKRSWRLTGGRKPRIHWLQSRESVRVFPSEERPLTQEEAERLIAEATEHERASTEARELFKLQAEEERQLLLLREEPDELTTHHPEYELD